MTAIALALLELTALGAFLLTLALWAVILGAWHPAFAALHHD